MSIGLLRMVGCLSAVVTVASTAQAEELPSWSKGNNRLFLSTRAEAGSILRATAASGYGKPHWIWAGTELQGLTSTESSVSHAVLKVSTPVADASLGVRQWWSHGKGALPVKDSYDATDLEHRVGPRARQLSLLAAVGGWVPLGRFGLSLDSSFTCRLEPSARDVNYDEYYRVIGTGYQLWDASLGVAAALDEKRRFWVAAQGEVLYVPGREDGLTLRVGPSAFWSISDQWDAGLLLSAPVRSPDDLSLVQATTGAVVVRWSWATGKTGP
jgi:hypothetical protein